MKPEAQNILNKLPATVSAMLERHGDAFYTWQAERVQSGGYAREGSDARDRFERCYDAAADGCDGSTHRENIQDFREFGSELFREASHATWGLDLTDDEGKDLEAEIEGRRAEFMADCDALEAWHLANGSLEQAGG